MEEALENVSLFAAEIFYAVDRVKVAKVGVDLSGVGHVLVDVIKVCKHALPPAVEVLYRLVGAG